MSSVSETNRPASGKLRPWRGCLLVDSALAVVLLVSLAAWFFDPLQVVLAGMRVRIRWGMEPILVLFALLAIRVGMRVRSGTSHQPAPRLAALAPRLALSFSVVLVALLGVEGLLALAGVPRGEAVFAVRGADGVAMHAGGAMVSDPDLLWRFEPGKTFHGRAVNEFGFLGEAVNPEKAPGMQRLIAMGDSCTAQGHPTYAERLHALLQEEPWGDSAWEAFNVGVHGYTVLQGLALFRGRVREMHPDVVTIFFGWNDHLLAEQTDRERLQHRASPWRTAVRNGWAQKRMAVAAGRRSETEPEPMARLRVPPEDYQEALRTLIREIEAIGAAPWVLTAPRAESLHPHLVQGGHIPSIEEGIRRHDEYIELTRAVAAQEGARVVDLAQKMQAPEYFLRDGIHFTDAGLDRVAALLHEALKEYDPD